MRNVVIDVRYAAALACYRSPDTRQIAGGAAWSPHA